MLQSTWPITVCVCGLTNGVRVWSRPKTVVDGEQGTTNVFVSFLVLVLELRAGL